MKIKCGFFTNIAPLYSKPMWFELTASSEIEYYFYSSKVGFSGIKTIDINESKLVNENGRLNWNFLGNISFKNIIFYQIGLVSKCFKTNYDAYIIYGEMYNISIWIASLVCRIRRKPVLFWGHGIYGNENFIKKLVRVAFSRFANYQLVYGNRAKNLMIESGFHPDKIFVVYNSLDYNLHNKLYEERNIVDLEKLKFSLFPNSSESPVVMFIGRLTKEKKIDYLLKAHCMSREKGINYNCLIIGDGEELNYLKSLTNLLGTNNYVSFYGSSYNEKINSQMIMLSECCVSPGNVGLTAIHSLSFGTPVITHNNWRNQGPEVESIINDETGFLFEENDIKSLSKAIEDLVLGKKKQYMENKCLEQIRLYWNPSNQAAVFDKAVLNSIHF